jgi:outer membrane receptor protein involved in Fe transport
MAGHAPAQNSLPSADFDHVGHVFFGSAQYLRGEDHTVALTFAQGFRAPNLNEAVMLGDTGKFFHIPNDDLGPERSDTIELAGSSRVWRIDAGLASYVSFLHDLIKREETEWEGQSEIGGKPVVWNVNGEEGILWGIEPRVAADLGQGVVLSGSLAYTWGKEKVTGGPDEPLTRIPPLFGQVRLRWDAASVCHGRVFVEGYVRGATKQDRLSSEDESDARIPPGGTPGWWTWNARLGYVTDNLAWTLAVENITNEAYKYHGSGVYAPGTNAILSVEAFR